MFFYNARNIGNKYGKSIINSKSAKKIFDVSKSMKNIYGKKIVDNSLRAGKDFAKIAGKKVLTKSAEATGDLIGNKIADRITKSARNKETQEDLPTTDYLHNTTNSKFKFKFSNSSLSKDI